MGASRYSAAARHGHQGASASRGTLARLRYETLDHEDTLLDTWEVRALVPNIRNGVGPFWSAPCGRSCREELEHSSGFRLDRSGTPGIAEEWVLRMPVGRTFDIEPSPMRMQDILDRRERVVPIGSLRVGSQTLRNPASIRVTLVDACHGTVRVGSTNNLLFQSRMPIPRGFETSQWAQLDGCGTLEPLPPPPARKPPARITIPEPPDLRAVVVHRQPGTGHVDLKVDEAWLGKHGAPVMFEIARVCRYDPGDGTWRKVLSPYSNPFGRLAPPTPGQASQGDRIVYQAPREIGLFWVYWSEEVEDNQSARSVRWRDAHLVSGPVLCNDVMLGSAPPGMVAACVPFANRAEARFVPEPAKTCGR